MLMHVWAPEQMLGNVLAACYLSLSLSLSLEPWDVLGVSCLAVAAACWAKFHYSSKCTLPVWKVKSSQFWGEQLAIVEIAKGAKGHSKTVILRA
jgi:hypothetical protein